MKQEMILDYMNQGFLDNIVALMKQDEALLQMLPDMMKDERIKVRLGTASLLEQLVEWDAAKLFSLIPAFALLLADENPTIRGDAASVLEMIGNPDALVYLNQFKNEENLQVREIILEAIEILESSGN